MRIESIITKETLRALNDLKFVTFKPKQVNIRQVPMGTLSKLYPLELKKGEDGRRLMGGLPPSTSVTNSAHVWDMVRTSRRIRSRV